MSKFKVGDIVEYFDYNDCIQTGVVVCKATDYLEIVDMHGVSRPIGHSRKVTSSRLEPATTLRFFEAVLEVHRATVQNLECTIQILKSKQQANDE